MKLCFVASAAAAVVLIAGCDASAPTATNEMVIPASLKPANAAIVFTTNERDVPWSDVQTNPCNGDIVTLTGNTHFVIHTGFDALGGFHYSSNVVSKGFGTGTTLTYKASARGKSVTESPANTDGYVINEMQTLKLDAPKTADDYFTVFTFKITVDANGNVVVERETTDTRCGA